MYSVDHILAVIDPDAPRQRAMQRGVWLARHLEAQLELFVSDYHPALADTPFTSKFTQRKARESFIGQRKKWLEELAAPYRKDGLHIATDAVWGKPFHDEINRKTFRSGTDLVVKATEYESKIRRTLFTSSDWQLIRECPAPVWFTKLDEIPDEPDIIAAIDPMTSDEKPEYLNEDILAIASVLRQGLNARLHAANWLPMSLNTQTSVQAAKDFRRMQRDQVNHVLQNFPEVDADNVHLAVGRDDSFLLELVTKFSAKLVVMGSIARGRMQRLVLGSTAEHMLNQLPCDVLVVKADDFVSPIKL